MEDHVLLQHADLDFGLGKLEQRLEVKLYYTINA